MNYDEEKAITLYDKKIYSSRKYDITTIEINPDLENIYNFLELDANVLREKYELGDLNQDNFQDVSFQYSLEFGKRKGVSFGIIREIPEKQNFFHYCSTRNGASGSPVLNIENNKLIGIHIGGYKIGSSYFANLGLFLNYPIHDFNNDLNLIKKYENKDQINIIRRRFWRCL